MGGFLYFLGFALPFAIALDLTKDGPRDSFPSRGLCCLCKRWKEDTYLRGYNERVCSDDVVGVVHRSGARRILAAPRPLEQWPLERVAEKSRDAIPLDPWWDRQFV